jgi:hypothetical protein
VQPVPGGFAFSIDGVLHTTIAVNIPAGTPLKIAMSDYNGTPGLALQADWVRWTGGTFTSSVFDAGKTATWGTASWTANLAAGTSIVVETSSSADGSTWSAWSAVTNGGSVASPAARYLRYRVRLITNDPTLTPTLYDISFFWN